MRRKEKIRQELIDKENRRTGTSAHSPGRHAQRKPEGKSTSHFVDLSWKRSAKGTPIGNKAFSSSTGGASTQPCFCPECGYVEQCKDCSIAMTYHRTDGYLRCHLLQLSKARSESMSGMPFIRHSKKRAWDAKNRGYRERPSSKQNRRNENRCGHDDEKKPLP